MKLFKRILSAGIAMLCAISVFLGLQLSSVNAETYSDQMQYGDYLYYEQVDEDDDGIYDYIKISGCDKSATEVEIPSEIDGLQVISIGMTAFSGCKSLESVTMGNSVTSIRIYAFSGCTSLISVEIPDSVTAIGAGAFYGCTSLESVTIGKGVTTIGYHTFSGCISLTSIEIPANVETIVNNAFDECESLESITIYNSECEIYDDEYTIPDTATIYGYEDSTAQAYAEEFSRSFVSFGVLGDANNDGKVSALDASVIAKTLAQASIVGKTITVDDYPTMDYNGDGKITALDASAIAKYLAQKTLQQ